MAESKFLVKCPACRKEIEYESSEYRPFCSERCKILDLGAWADEEYSLPAETNALSEEDVEKIARMREGKEEK